LSFEQRAQEKRHVDAVVTLVVVIEPGLLPLIGVNQGSVVPTMGAVLGKAGVEGSGRAVDQKFKLVKRSPKAIIKGRPVSFTAAVHNPHLITVMSERSNVSGRWWRGRY